MPVVVTGASGAIGRHVVPAFTMASPEVRAYVRRREAADALRAAGAKVAVGELADADRLETVLQDAHTVCHLVGGLAGQDEAELRQANLDSVRQVLNVAVRSGVRRILLVSCPGASPEASNAFLRFKGQAEQAVRESALEHVIVRSAHVLAEGSQWASVTRRLAARRPSVVVGSGQQVWAPVAVEDLAAVLVAADDRDLVRSGTWGLEGPERLTADEVADRLFGRRRPRLHLPPGGAARLPGIALGPIAMDVLARDSVADGPDGAAEFGVRRTPLVEALRPLMAGRSERSRE